MVELDKPIDLEDPAAPDSLDRVQGNIIKGHGHDRTAPSFLTIPALASTCVYLDLAFRQ
jgi:hypothetical protein